MKIRYFPDKHESPVTPDQMAACLSHIVASEGNRIHGEIRVVLTDDDTILELNRTYLKHDYPTDVISFPLKTDRDSFDGEIYISCDRAREQAIEFRNSYREELLRLAIHGTLHLMGYDDDSPGAREAMKAKEEHYLAFCGKGAGP